jgi:hypothetical protein
MASYSLTTPMGSKCIYINTLNLPSSSLLNGSKKSNLQIQLNESIKINNTNQKMLLSLYTASIPNSFYNISSSQNKFNFKEASGGDWKNIIVPPGNYNSRNLATTIIGLMNSESQNTFTYSLQYSAIYNKYDLICSDTLTTIFLDFNVSNSIYKACGFDKTTYNFTSSITSPNIIQIYDEYSIFLHCSLCNNNSLNTFGKASSILEKIPIRGANSVSFFESGLLQQKQLLSVESIDNFYLSLTNSEGEYIDFLGADLELVLRVEYVTDLNHTSKEIASYDNLIKPILMNIINQEEQQPEQQPETQ